MFETGGARKCRCQALKVPGWIWRDTTQEERDVALLEQAGCGTSGPTSGLVGYVDGEPVLSDPLVDHVGVSGRHCG